MEKKRSFYLIGDPVKREKIRSTVRTAWYSFVYAFACIGLGNTIYFVWRVLHG